MLIEVFRAGNAAAASQGITAADLADVAAFDCSNHPVPNVIGHPKTDAPAHGAVVKFVAEGNSLFADIPERLPAFKAIVDGIKGSSILNRSMGFFGRNHKSNPTPGKIAPKHLGFLGGAAPGIPGMPALASYFAANPETTLTFSADDVLEVVGDPAPAVIFDAPPTAVFTFTEAAPAASQETGVQTPEEIKEAADKLALDRKTHEDEVKAFAVQRTTARNASSASAVKALVTSGIILPADETDLVAAFAAIDGDNVLTFADKAEGTPVSRILAIMAKGGKVVPIGDQHSQEGDAPTFAAQREDDLAKVRVERSAKYNK